MRTKLLIVITIIIVITIAIILSGVFIVLGNSTSNEDFIQVKYSQLSNEDKTQIDCLADNVYYEAGGEPEVGKIAVALVTLNRTQSSKFPSKICSVVKQRVRSKCQFSWFCAKKRKIEYDTYMKSQEIALFVYTNYDKVVDVTNGALYYHADYVNPRWKLEKTAQIGRHIFYKEREPI